MMRNKYVLPVMAVACAIAVIGMIFALIFGEKAVTKYELPKFDSKAVAGIPNVPRELGYAEIYQEGMSFKAGVCGRIIVSGNATDLYFTNLAENAVWLKLRIFDENTNTIGESGLIKPGEYVKSVSFDTVPEEGAKLTLKIMAYEPDTYYSAGSVSLNTSVSGG